MPNETATPDNALKKARAINKFSPLPPAWWLTQEIPHTPLIEGLLTEGESLMVYGKSGSGKSLFTYSLIEALSSHRGEFIGRECAVGKKVLYLDGEMSNRSIQARMMQLGANENITYCAVVNSPEPWNLCIEADVGEVLRMAKDYDLVVLDSVRTLFMMSDENSMDSWQPVNSLVTSLRGVGCTVIVIHHANKGEDTVYAGSSNAITVFDRTLGVTQNQRGVWQLQPEKCRDGEGWGRWVTEQSLVVGADGFEVEDVHTVKEAQLRSVKDALDALSEGAGSRERVSAVNGILDFGVGNKPTFAELWKSGKEWFLYWEDDLGIATQKDMAAWINNPILPEESETTDVMPLDLNTSDHQRPF